jgi:hypothetical protein
MNEPKKTEQETSPPPPVERPAPASPPPPVVASNPIQECPKVEEASRRRSLGTDPASGRYRPGEEAAAVRLEQKAGPLRRDPSGTGDWLDKGGRSYDAVGPVPAGRFDLGQFNRQIDRHLLKQGLDFVVVDLSDLSSTDRASVLSHISGLAPAQQARIIVQ